MAIVYSRPNVNDGSPPVLSDIGRVYHEARKQGVELYPFDIETLLLKMTFKVLKEELDGDLSGYIEKRRSGWIIGVNKYQSPRRQRFTMAHEFGHYVLHLKHLEEKGRWEDVLLMRSDEKNILERQANEFASDLLMPKQAFEAAISEGDNEIEKLADRFNVSIAATRYRAFKLGYLDRY